MPTNTYTFGEVCTMTAVPDSCCVFSHWVDDRNPCVVYSTNTEITIPVVENAYFHAVFVPKIVHVNVLLNIPSLGGTTGSGMYECGTEITITAFTNTCNNIVWRESLPCGDNTVSEDGECPNGIKTISCTFVVTDDITIYADIAPNYYTAHTRPCPVNGGNTGIIQNTISGFIPNVNGVPCIPFSGDGETFFGCEPITFIASPNNGFTFLGWVSVSDSEFENDTCDTCETQDYVSTERIYETYLCEDTNLVACFKRHFLIRFIFNGCGQSLITYSVENGEPITYTGPFYVNDGDSFHVYVDTDECCEVTEIKINGQSSGNSGFDYIPTDNTVVEFNSETRCFTIDMVMSGDCEIETPFSYCVLPCQEEQIYTEPITNVPSGANYLFSINDETECCKLKFWRIYYNGQITTSYDGILEIDDINGNITIEGVLESVCHAVTCVISGDCEPTGKLYYLEVLNGVLVNVAEITDWGFYAKENFVYYLSYSTEDMCCKLYYWNIHYPNSSVITSEGEFFLNERYNFLELGAINSDITVEGVFGPETDENVLTINVENLYFGGELNVVIEDLTSGEFFAPFNCGSEVQISINKCHKIKVYFSVSYSPYSLYYNVDYVNEPHIDYIYGKLLNENNVEYQNYKHGYFYLDDVSENYYFLYNIIEGNYVCCAQSQGKKYVNAIIIELDMKNNRTVSLVFSNSSQHSSNQSYYYKDGTYEFSETATMSDFYCPFLNNCVGIQEIQNICVGIPEIQNIGSNI